jgi:serine/threonine-protein kinase
MIPKFAKLAILIVVFLVVAGASAYLTLTLIIKSEDTVIVPDLVGKDVVTALEQLTDLQLNTKVNGSEYSRQFPKNHIIFQEPEPGSEIKKDRDICPI